MTTIPQAQSAIAAQQQKIQEASIKLRAVQNDYATVQTHIERATASGDVAALELLQTRLAALRAIVPTLLGAVREAEHPLTHLNERLSNTVGRRNQLAEQVRDLERAVKSGIYEKRLREAKQAVTIAESMQNAALLQLEKLKLELLEMSN